MFDLYEFSRDDSRSPQYKDSEHKAKTKYLPYVKTVTMLPADYAAYKERLRYLEEKHQKALQKKREYRRKKKSHQKKEPSYEQ